MPEVGLTIQNGRNRISVAPKPGIGHHILPFLVSERAPPSPQKHHPIRVKPGITHTDYSSEKKSFTISQKKTFYTPRCTRSQKTPFLMAKPGTEYRILYFCILMRILRGFSAQQQLLSGPEVPKTSISNGVFEPSAKKCIFTRLLPCKARLAEVCRSKFPI